MRASWLETGNRGEIACHRRNGLRLQKSHEHIRGDVVGAHLENALGLGPDTGLCAQREARAEQYDHATHLSGRKARHCEIGCRWPGLMLPSERPLRYPYKPSQFLTIMSLAPQGGMPFSGRPLMTVV